MLPLSPSADKISPFHNPTNLTFTQNVLALENSVSKCWKTLFLFSIIIHQFCVIIHLVAARFSGTPASSIPGFPPPAIKTPPPDSPWAAVARPASSGGGWIIEHGRAPRPCVSMISVMRPQEMAASRQRRRRRRRMSSWLSAPVRSGVGFTEAVHLWRLHPRHFTPLPVLPLCLIQTLTNSSAGVALHERFCVV